MVIMECRKQMLEWLLNGFKLTGIHLVGHNGNSFVPFCMYDDIGSYVLLPSFIRLTHLSLEQGYHLFYFGMLGISIIVALMSLYKIFAGSLLSRLYLLIGFLPLLFFVQIGRIGDVYIAYLCAALCAIPTCLLLIDNKASTTTQVAGFGLIGAVSQLFNYIRAHAALGPLVFVGLYTISASTLSWQKKVMILLALWAGMQATTIYFDSTISRYRDFITTHSPDAHAMSLQHVFWHTAYLGFGFLKLWNTEDIEWNDRYADIVVRSKDPSISIEQTEKYEAVLKDMVVDLVKNKTFFVIMTLAAKCGILLLFFLFFMHFGLVAAALIYSKWQLHLCFLAALGTSMAFPLLSQPLFSYSASFITLTILYSLTCISYWLQKISFTELNKYWPMPFKRLLSTNKS